MKGILAGLLAVVLGAGVAARGEFVPGHLYVSAFGGKPACFEFGDPEAIIEIDPGTAEMRVFAHSDDHDMCSVSGLLFTPDGGRLLQLNWWYSQILSFSRDGSSEIYLDTSDGLNGPFGANGLAFDAGGDLYVADWNSRILRFPADGGPATVFADGQDGLRGGGALDFAPNGDLFYCGIDAEGVIRITPQGGASLFDPLPEPGSLGFDRAGNLFVTAGQVGVGPTIYRYDDADPDARRILAEGFVGWSGQPNPLTLSPDGSTVYYADGRGELYAIDADDGEVTYVGNIQLPGVRGHGMYAAGLTFLPLSPGDIDADGDVDLEDFAAFDVCFTGPAGEPPGPQCQPADIDDDGDVDWADFARFQVAFTGS
jgi:sugar lactone lactonase YvrE